MKHTGWVAPAVFLGDQATKALALRLPPEGLVLIPGVLALRLRRNTGMAFSLLSGYPGLLGALSLILMAGAFLLLRKKRMPALARTGLMMMLGGAAGNAADRLIRGYVIDMVEPLFVNFAVFNLADACLVVGCGLVMIAILRGGREAPEEGKQMDRKEKGGSGSL